MPQWLQKIDIKERRHVTDKSDIIVKFWTVHTVQTLPELTIFILYKSNSRDSQHFIRHGSV